MSRVNEIEIGDTLEQSSKTMNGNLLFSFETLHHLSIEPVTPTKFSENSKFFKKSINNLLFTLKLIIKKNLRIHHFWDSNLVTQILSKLDIFSKTIKSQTAHIGSKTAHIVALEKWMEELIF